ncbi:hypothetical protein [Clostridium beijerinckii]|uniref:hypothetical protein n=1 Tax=Clostridium beijerinckii TaxID=1520 RepID=UPI00098C2D0D|nr:hypothetical protein [Clostridium beijerinckii]NRT80326.1 hypothetical protein [Clostridium beijerinckii]OOM45159.1 hypothetical protein CBEIJ_34050 [Clostridium beijerinckii]
MHILVIYDTTGYLIDCKIGTGFRLPIGVPYIETDIESSKIVTGVDVSVTPNTLILEDAPRTDIEKLQEQVANLIQANAELTSIVATMETTNA